MENIWGASVPPNHTQTQVYTGMKLYTKVQGRVNVYAKMKSKHCKKGVVPCKSMYKLVWLDIWNSFSLIFPKIVVLKFLGKYVRCRSLLSRCGTCSLEHYWRQTQSQIFSCKLFEISDNSDPNCGTTWSAAC